MQILREKNDNYNIDTNDITDTIDLIDIIDKPDANNMIDTLDATDSATERLNPLNDFVFKQYMGTEEYKICLLSFLNAVLYGTTLREKITEVEIIKNMELPKETQEGKFSRLDVRATLPDGTQLNVEVQLRSSGNMVFRSEYYNGRMFVSGINSGEEYDSLKKVITINILDYDLHDYPEFHISSHFRVDQHPEIVMSELQEIHFIEVRKFLRSNQFDKNNELHRWLKFFDRNLKEDELKELIQMDKAIAAADERSRKVAATPEEMRYYEALEDARREMISSQHYYGRKGEEKGRIEGKIEGKAEEQARTAALLNRMKQDNRINEFLQAITNLEAKEKLYKEYGL